MFKKMFDAEDSVPLHTTAYADDKRLVIYNTRIARRKQTTSTRHSRQYTDGGDGDGDDDDAV